MTALETIKFVGEKLAEQGCQSVATKEEADALDMCVGSCMYRGPENRKCGGGWLIPDELYDRAMENRSVVYVCINWSAVGDAMLPTDLTREEGFVLLRRIQNIHDHWIPERWPEKFGALDSEYAQLTATT